MGFLSQLKGGRPPVKVTASQILQYTRNSIYEKKKVKNGHAFARKQILSVKENMKSGSTCPTSKWVQIGAILIATRSGQKSLRSIFW